MSAPKGNKYAVGHNQGRPAHYESAEELIKACDEYFQFIKGEQGEDIQINIEGSIVTQKQWIREPEPPTVTGLALYLGFDSRQSLYDYGKKEDFSYIIKKAKTLVENGYEKQLYSRNATGAIFALKNMNWSDKKEVDMTTKGESINRKELSPEQVKDITKNLNKEI